MGEPSTYVQDTQGPPEVSFARVLENFQLNSEAMDPFEVTKNFFSISAAKALEVATRISELGHESAEDKQELESWDLETKLWHLVTILYSFRLSSTEQPTHYSSFSSLTTKQTAYIQENPKVRELMLIMSWIQFHSQETNMPQLNTQTAKWANTKVALKTQALASLTSSNKTNYVQHLDNDAVLRSSKGIATEDSEIDSLNFTVIYNLILAGQYQQAVDYATQTGNFSMALILSGIQHDYFDPVIDGNREDDMHIEDEDSDDKATDPSGLKHKFLMLQTLLKLSEAQGLNESESLIYSFLSGGDQSNNIRVAGNDWDTCLLIYINQLVVHKFVKFIKNSYSLSESNVEIIPSINFPTPQHGSIDNILNSLSQSSALTTESKNPFRVIMGSIIIDQLLLFLENSFRSSKSDLLEDQHILRVLAHLAVFVSMLDLHEGSKTPTKIITTYITRLSKFGYEDLVPIYLSFIPDEGDVRECYSIFLSTITDPKTRARQLEIFKRLGIRSASELALESHPQVPAEEYENKIQNVLKRTVERVMMETEPYYQPPDQVEIKDSEVDSTDIKLYKSVDWFYENNMYEDAIIATLTIFQRFLLVGRLRSIREFGKNKSLKTLIKDFDLQMHTKSMGNGPVSSQVHASDKDELLQYDRLLECLQLVDEWQSFVDNASLKFWKSKDVEQSIEKTIHKINDFISTWFIETIELSQNLEKKEFYKGLRSIYVPYFIIEFLQVLFQSRLNDEKYLRQAFHLVNEVAYDKKNDYLSCFMSCGRLSEFVILAGEVAAVALEKEKGKFA